MLSLVSEAGIHLEIYCPAYVQKLLQGLSSACAHALSQGMKDSKVGMSVWVGIVGYSMVFNMYMYIVYFRF